MESFGALGKSIEARPTSLVIIVFDYYHRSNRTFKIIIFGEVTNKTFCNDIVINMRQGKQC